MRHTFCHNGLFTLVTIDKDSSYKNLTHFSCYDRDRYIVSGLKEIKHDAKESDNLSLEMGNRNFTILLLRNILTDKYIWCDLCSVHCLFSAPNELLFVARGTFMTWQHAVYGYTFRNVILIDFEGSHRLNFLRVNMFLLILHWHRNNVIWYSLVRT